MTITLYNETLELLPQKAIFWPRERALLIADAHFGKVGHFRRAGVPVPNELVQNDIEILTNLLKSFQPQKVIFLGDLFHSNVNYEWEMFGQWRNLFKNVEFHLVKGNHDRREDEFFKNFSIELHDPVLKIKPFIFSHIPFKNSDEIPLHNYVLAGHIHPGVKLTGKGKSVLKLPCFYFGERQGILPAFGGFTGLGMIQPERNSQVFVIAEDEVLKL
jgi:DNA ligase-associated metallophosphoesterase